jgi:hypothetical protein
MSQLPVTNILQIRCKMLDSPLAVHIRLLLRIISYRSIYIKKREGDDVNWQERNRRNWT